MIWYGQTLCKGELYFANGSTADVAPPKTKHNYSWVSARVKMLSAAISNYLTARMKMDYPLLQKGEKWDPPPTYSDSDISSIVFTS